MKRGVMPGGQDRSTALKGSEGRLLRGDPRERRVAAEYRKVCTPGRLPSTFSSGCVVGGSIGSRSGLIGRTRTASLSPSGMPSLFLMSMAYCLHRFMAMLLASSLSAMVVLVRV